MRTRAVLPLAVLAAGGLCFYFVHGLEDPSPRPRIGIGADAGVTEDLPAPAAASLEAGAAAEAPAAPIDDSSTVAMKARIAGVPPPPPDSLVAVHGRVVDAVSGEPVEGITLSFLSRRPRTCAARTDAQGRFSTAAELASGVVAVAHVPDPDSIPFSARWQIEPTSFLAAAPAAPAAPGALAAPGTPGAAATGAPEENRELVLAARAPERELAIDVRLPDGDAAAGAAVSLTWGRRDPAGRFVAEGRAYEDTDEYGRARFALFGPDAWDRSLRVEAEHDGTLASDVLSLDPPLGRVIPVLDLQAGGVLRVRTTNDEGRPVSGVSLWIEAQDETGTIRGRAGDTDARGECIFTTLRSGCYTLSALHPATGEDIRREVDLARGAQESVDVRLTLAGLQLRVAGTVGDEHGFPLSGVAVRAQAAGESPVSLATGEGGRFEFWGRPCDGVLFTAGGGFLDDRYDPEVMAVPCGSTGLNVRRLSKLEESSWPLEVFDRATGEPVRAALVTLYHGDPRASSIAVQGFTASAGLVQVVFKRRDDLGYAVDAPGYLREQGLLSGLLEAASRKGALHVELDRGFERRLDVRDRITRRGISHALLSSGSVLLGRADEHGSVHVRADEWPAQVRVESPGYAPLTWDPATAGFPGDVIWLEPLRAGN